MRIDSMDAQFKVVDRVAEIPLPVQGQQKTIPVQRTEDYKPEVISEKVVISAIEKANKAMVAANRALNFQFMKKQRK